MWLKNPLITTDIRFENSTGLSQVYNSCLSSPQVADAILFVHDDIWLDDPEWLQKLMVALTQFDVVGVAGDTRISPQQPAWLFKEIHNGQFVSDSPYLSGAMGRGQLPRGQISVFGPTPANCELVDGAFLAVRSMYVQRAQVFFDERFDFHFYDMDFCRTAKSAGLSIATWPISLTHQSAGSLGSPSWQLAYERYLKKWKS